MRPASQPQGHREYPGKGHNSRRIPRAWRTELELVALIQPGARGSEAVLYVYRLGNAHALCVSRHSDIFVILIDKLL